MSGTPTPAVSLTVGSDRLSVCRLPTVSPVPAWAGGKFLSITRTPHELSIVCDATDVPADVTSHGPFRALMVVGPLDFALTGVLAGILTPLAEARVSVFTIATYDTDYVLVREQDLARAVAALRDAGYAVDGA